MPAPTASTATSVRPAGLPSAASGCRISSVTAVRVSSFRVLTTSPMTLANCICFHAGGLQAGLSWRRRLIAGGDVHGVDDADDGRIDRTILHARRHARRTAADDEHGFADSRVHR